MIVKLLTEHHLECLSLKGGCRGSSESTHVKMPHCWKSHAIQLISRVSQFIPLKYATDNSFNSLPTGQFCMLFVTILLFFLNLLLKKSFRNSLECPTVNQIQAGYFVCLQTLSAEDTSK